MSISNVSHFLNFFSNLFHIAGVEQSKWVLGGSFAIDTWCSILNIPLLDQSPNNIDVVYSKSTPITPEYISNYKRVQTSPHTSVTYENPGFTPLNMTMTRNNIKYYEVEGLKIMSPSSLLSWYEDEPEFYQDKITLLRDIISRTSGFEFKYIYAREPLRVEVETPAKRRLVNILI